MTYDERAERNRALREATDAVDEQLAQLLVAEAKRDAAQEELNRCNAAYNEAKFALDRLLSPRVAS